MKVSATSDIHHPKNASKLESAIAEMTDSDVVVIAGDISYDVRTYSRVLNKFRHLAATKVTVLGNHDLYVGTDGDSLEKVALLADICRRNDFHLLDESPLIIGDVAFVGNIGWYDYQFAQKKSDEEVIVLGKDKVYSTTINRMDDADFEAKRYRVRGTTTTWQDRGYIHWDFSDKEFLELQLRKLKHNLEEVSPKVNKIVYVSHHIPIWQFVRVKADDPQWGLFNAYQGSPRLGEVALANPKLAAIICGHSHLYGSTKIGNVDCYDVSREFGELVKIDIAI